MPLKKCSVGGKSGWKYGDSGKCYPGKEGKKKAIKQALAYDKENFVKESLAAGLETHQLQQMLAGEFEEGFDKITEKDENEELSN